MVDLPRRSGILLHITSLPGGAYTGDLGPSAHAFADFLAEAGQGWWQTLPLNPIGDSESPYSSVSAFACEPLMISPEALVEDGLLEEQALHGLPIGSTTAQRRVQRIQAHSVETAPGRVSKVRRARATGHATVLQGVSRS